MKNGNRYARLKELNLKTFTDFLVMFYHVMSCYVMSLADSLTHLPSSLLTCRMGSTQKGLQAKSQMFLS